MINKVICFLLTLSTVLIIGCHKNDSVVNPVLEKGKFVIDSLTYNITLEKAYNDSLWHFIETRIVYHFENYRGTLSEVVCIINDSLGLVFNSHIAYPDSVNKFRLFHPKIPLLKKLIDGDSTKVELSFLGFFFQVEGTNYNLTDTFYSYKKNVLYYRE